MGDFVNMTINTDVNTDRFIESIEKAVAEAAPDLKKLALDIHANPELGRQEYKAAKWQAELMTKYGFEVEEEYLGIPTAYKAVYKSGKPGLKIAMLAEYDALPEIGHACGHNLIAMIGTGSGIAIKHVVDELGGEVHVIGTPAEETEGAKATMARMGAFKEYDVAMMAHPFEEAGSSMNTSAMYARKFEFFGRTSHAAGAPEEGINALDAMINFFNLINALRQQTKDDARIHGIITHGGSAANVIPEYTSSLFYIRAHKVAYVEELFKKISACAEGAAVGTGCTVKISKVEEDFKDLCTNMYLNELSCQMVEKFGEKLERFGLMTIGGSSDAGDVSYECPTVQLAAGMGPREDGKSYAPHTIEFTEMTCTEQAMNHCLSYAKGFAMTAAQLLSNPAHMEAIRAEFDKMEKI